MASKRLKFRRFALALLFGSLLAGGGAKAPAQEIFAEPDQTLFTVMAAINAAGYNEGADLPHLTPVRASLRADLEGLELPSIVALREFYAAHRLADPVRDLSQYVSFALLLSGPPHFEFTLSPSNLPPDVLELRDLPPLIAAFYEQADVPSLWAKYLERMQQDAEQYQRLLAGIIQETTAYLRMETPNYLGVKFAVLVNPLGAPGQVDARNYGDNYYIVASPSSTLPEAEIRHAWLHYLLDGFVMKYPAIVQAKSELAEMTQRAPALEPAFRENFALLLTESLIRAIQVRFAAGDDRARLSLVLDAAEEGFLLAPYFYDALKTFVDQPVGLRLYFPELLDGIQIDREKKRLAEVQFKPASTRRLQETRWSPREQMLREAQGHLARAEYDQARKVYEMLETQYGPQAPVQYGLALVASQQQRPEAAKEYFRKAAALAYDSRTKAWSHIYLGRLLDLEGKREEAKLQYSAALSVGMLSSDTKAAAEQGLKEQFAAPGSAGDRPAETEPARQRVPLGRPDGEAVPQ